MTKRWSSTRSDLTKTKRQASRDVRAEARREHDRLMREDPKYRESYNEVDRIWKAALRPHGQEESRE
jgi:hypothetical protein